MILKYKPEIDSLRAISVIAVIIYHAKIYLFGNLALQGGYFGVDIFFVISGYLITSIIYYDLIENKFSFKNFYLKRARRILPALLLTIIISLILSWFSLMPSAFIDYSKSILYSLGFISNYYFYFSGLEYGAVSGLLKPLLHTWSLGIEEQFYIIFPLFLIFGYNFFKKNLIFYIFIFFLLSFFIALYFSKINPALNFYLLPSRVWELLIGCLLFFFGIKLNFKVSKIVSNLSTLFGLLLIFVSFTIIYDIEPSPNLKTLVPLIGTSIIILFYKKEGILNILFTNKLTIWIGLTSYSLYLIHYPVFAFVRANRLTQGIYEYSLVVIIIIICSSLSYLFIEKPFRNRKFISDKSFIKILIFFVIFLLSILFTIINKKGFENRFPSTSTFSLDYQKYLREVRLLKYEFGIPNYIHENKKNILIIGNSHGRGTFNAFKLNEKLFSDYEFSIIDIPIHCLKNINKNYMLCDNDYMTKLQKEIFLKSELILLSSAYDKKDLYEIENIIKNLISLNKTIIIASRKPSFYFKNYQSLIDKFFIENQRLPNEDENIVLKKEYFLSRNKKIPEKNFQLKSIAKKYKLLFLDMFEILCEEKNQLCDFLTPEGQKIIFDGSHYTVDGAKYVGQRIYNLKWLKIE